MCMHDVCVCVCIGKVVMNAHVLDTHHILNSARQPMFDKLNAKYGEFNFYLILLLSDLCEL